MPPDLTEKTAIFHGFQRNSFSFKRLCKQEVVGSIPSGSTTTAHYIYYSFQWVNDYLPWPLLVSRKCLDSHLSLK